MIVVVLQLALLALRLPCVFIQSVFCRIRVLVKTKKKGVAFTPQRFLADKPSEPFSCWSGLAAFQLQRGEAGAACQWAAKSAPQHAVYLTGVLISAPAFATLNGEFSWAQAVSFSWAQAMSFSENPPGGPWRKMAPKGKASLLESYMRFFTQVFKCQGIQISVQRLSGLLRNYLF